VSLHADRAVVKGVATIPSVLNFALFCPQDLCAFVSGSFLVMLIERCIYYFPFSRLFSNFVNGSVFGSVFVSISHRHLLTCSARHSHTQLISVFLHHRTIPRITICTLTFHSHLGIAILSFLYLLHVLAASIPSQSMCLLWPSASCTSYNVISNGH
jgi:hypothetical protein